MSISETNYSIYQHSLQHKNYINLYIQTDIYIYTVVKLYRFLVIFKHIFTLDNVDYVKVNIFCFRYTALETLLIILSSTMTIKKWYEMTVFNNT